MPANEWKAKEHKCSQGLDKKCGPARLQLFKAMGGTSAGTPKLFSNHHFTECSTISLLLTKTEPVQAQLEHHWEVMMDILTGVSVYTLLNIPHQNQSNQLMTLFQCCLLTAILMILSVQVDGERYTSVINSCS